MSELKVRLYQASFNPSHPCRGETTKIILINYISVSLLYIIYIEENSSAPNIITIHTIRSTLL